jgi:hypothetical protein
MIKAAIACGRAPSTTGVGSDDRDRLDSGRGPVSQGARSPPSGQGGQRPGARRGGTRPAPEGAPTKREWTGDHPLNIRVSLPTPFGRYYLTLVGGRERRAGTRRAAERQKHPLDTPANIAFLFLVGLVSAAGLLVLTYIGLVHGLGWSSQLALPA